MEAMVATVPLLVTLVLLTRPLPGWVPPAAGIVAAIVLGLTVLGARPAEFGGALGQGVPTFVEVLAIMAGGVTLARVMERGGANARLTAWLSSGAAPGLGTALLMIHGVVPFLETVTGFGVSVIVGLPLLLGLGFTPLRAAVLVLLGLTIGPWGSMAPGTLLGAQLGGLDFQEVGVLAAVLNTVHPVVSGATAALLVHRPGTRGGRATGMALGAVSGLVQSALILGANLTLGTAPAGAVAAFLMTVLWLLVLRRGHLAPGPGVAVLPYVVLMVGTVLGTALEGVLPASASALGALVGSPALWSFTGALLGMRLLRLRGEDARAVPGEAARLWAAIAIPTSLYLVLGYCLTAGGHSEALAGALAGLGAGYLAAAPFLAGVSGYITASNTGAMSMFGTVQMDTGPALGVRPEWMNALHNSAAGYAIIAGPARIETAYRMALPAQRADGAAAGERPVTRTDMLVWLVPPVLVGLSLQAAAAVIVLPGL